jgi:hypothetical protein
MGRRQNTAESFWDHVDHADPDCCWEWQKCKDRAGYGITNFNRKKAYSHRVAYMLAIGPIPDGLFVCHHCDNPGCCNPNHFFLGTVLDNTRDAANKGLMRHDAITKKKISNANMGSKNHFYGKHHSKETCQKIREALIIISTTKTNPMLGKTHSPEIRQKISSKCSGENAANFGKTLSDEVKKKISIAKRGKPITEEQRQKLRMAWVRRRLQLNLQKFEVLFT